MVDQEMLQAISEMMDQKMAAQKAEITQDTQHMLTAQKSEIAHETQLMMENYFDPKFNLLAENQQIMMEKLQTLDDLEVMDTRITALEAMVKKINRELKELKQAQ